MKKLVSMLLALAMLLTLAGGALAETKDYSGYTIRIYSNSNSTERVNWLLNAAKEAGFSISIDDNSVTATTPLSRRQTKARTATSSLV